SFFRPRSADAVGDVKERLGGILFAGAEISGEFLRGVARDFSQKFEVVIGPLFNLSPELDGFVTGGIEIEAGHRIRGAVSPEKNGNAARGQGARQVTITGKRFGTEERVLLAAKCVNTPSARAGIEPGEQRLALRRAEGVVAVVEEESYGRGLFFFVFVVVL